VYLAWLEVSKNCLMAVLLLTNRREWTQFSQFWVISCTFTAILCSAECPCCLELSHKPASCTHCNLSALKLYKLPFGKDLWRSKLLWGFLASWKGERLGTALFSIALAGWAQPCKQGPVYRENCAFPKLSPCIYTAYIPGFAVYQRLFQEHSKTV